ncbi:unnamed protein product [Effrenium voratum]|uniref:Uncharacterized protein n=1 Tax=Effrenium voratum TaxID=2562239 RepID=A0AA36IHX8_9DINO|nr:unnamed protein product [Effrenium voratum]
MEELETAKQQKAEIAKNLQKQLDELARQKAEEMKNIEDLQKANETLQQRIAFLTQKAQKSEMTQCILQLKEQCDAFLAFSRSDSDPQADEGPGATPASEDAVDSFTLVGDQSDMYSDTSSRSAKCFLPNTALHGLDGEACEAERADQLGVGNTVFVGGKQQKLTKERTHLYEVRLEPDGPLEMLPELGRGEAEARLHCGLPGCCLESEGKHTSWMVLDGISSRRPRRLGEAVRRCQWHPVAEIPRFGVRGGLPPTSGPGNGERFEDADRCERPSSAGFQLQKGHGARQAALRPTGLLPRVGRKTHQLDGAGRPCSQYGRGLPKGVLDLNGPEAAVRAPAAPASQVDLGVLERERTATARRIEAGRLTSNELCVATCR